MISNDTLSAIVVAVISFLVGSFVLACIVLWSDNLVKDKYFCQQSEPYVERRFVGYSYVRPADRSTTYNFCSQND